MEMVKTKLIGSNTINIEMMVLSVGSDVTRKFICWNDFRTL